MKKVEKRDKAFDLLSAQEREAFWERVRIDVGLGMPWRAIAEKHGGMVSYMTIKRRAEAELWDRRLVKRVKEQVDRRVMRNAVASRVTGAQRVTEQAAINAAADECVTVILEDKRGSNAAVRLSESVVQELIQISHPGMNGLINEALQQAAQGGTAALSQPVRDRIIEMVTGVATRSQSVQRAIAAYIQAAEFRRKVYRVDQQVPDEDPWKQIVDWITDNNKPLVAVQVNNNRLGNEWVKA